MSISTSGMKPSEICVLALGAYVKDYWINSSYYRFKKDRTVENFERFKNELIEDNKKKCLTFYMWLCMNIPEDDINKMKKLISTEKLLNEFAIKYIPNLTIDVFQ